MNDADNIGWGTADDGDNIVWGMNEDDNIVWGMNDDDNIVWGMSDDAAVMFSDDANEPLPSVQLEFGDVVPLLLPAPSLLGGL